jgi:hypothetical protein
VVFLFGQVLPRLASGVLIQIHDVFLPADYPEEWVLSGWAWNEQYLVQAFLGFNADFDVILSVPWLARRRPGVLDAVPCLPRSGPWSGASLWIRRGPGLSTHS